MAGTVASLQSVRSFDSPSPPGLSVLWTPVIKALLALTRARQRRYMASRRRRTYLCAPSDARLLLESYVPSLHLTYLVLLGTSAMQRKVVRTIDVSSFENSLAEITLIAPLMKGPVGAAGAPGVLRSGEARQKRALPGRCSPFRWDHHPLHDQSQLQAVPPTPPAPGKSPPLSAVCHTLTRLCRFVNQMAFHSVQSARDNVLLPLQWAEIQIIGPA